MKGHDHLRAMVSISRKEFPNTFDLGDVGLNDRSGSGSLCMYVKKNCREKAPIAYAIFSVIGIVISAKTFIEQTILWAFTT